MKLYMIERPGDAKGWATVSGRFDGLVEPDWRPATRRERVWWELQRHKRFSVLEFLIISALAGIARGVLGL